MTLLKRKLTTKLESVLSRGKSVLLLGPRQTGKTTLITHIHSDEFISLVDVRKRLRYEKEPGLLADEIEALAEDLQKCPIVVIDEVQKVPILMDAIQDLIDRKIAQFILTGSSARKLANLLPGRVITLHMDPLSIGETPDSNLMDLLLYGSLPGVLTIKNPLEKEELLESYVTTYLEEEVRTEALVRHLGNFARFLELAAIESGHHLNLNKLSQDIGVSTKMISSYYDILADCFVIERVQPLTASKSRRKLIKSERYLFFDLGVRRAACGEGVRLPTSYLGQIFEQFIGLELLRITRSESRKAKVLYWRDPNGPEVDWLIDSEGEYIPIEVKWTESPKEKDCRHLHTFLNEYEEAKKGYVICRTPKKMKLADNLYALPWQDLKECFPSNGP